MYISGHKWSYVSKCMSCHKAIVVITRRSYSRKKTKPLSKKQFDMFSTALLQLNFYL